MTTSGDPTGPDPDDRAGDRTDHDDRAGVPAHRAGETAGHDDWAGETADLPGVFVRYRGGRPQFGLGCAVFAIVTSVAVIVIFLLIIHAVAPLLGSVTPR